MLELTKAVDMTGARLPIAAASMTDADNDCQATIATRGARSAHAARRRAHEPTVARTAA
jgi:hypothetical protein